jgi:hypothetical protein
MSMLNLHRSVARQNRNQPGFNSGLLFICPLERRTSGAYGVRLRIEDRSKAPNPGYLIRTFLTGHDKSVEAIIHPRLAIR